MQSVLHASLNVHNPLPVSSRGLAMWNPCFIQDQGEVGVAPLGRRILMSLIVLTLRAPVGRPCRFAPLPAHVVVFAEPVGVVEGRVGEDVVGAEVGMEVAPEGVGVLGAEVGLDAAQGEVHDGEATGGGVALLAVDADVAKLVAVGFDEFFRLHEHAAGAAAGIVDAAFVRGEHLDEEADDALRGVELAAFFALSAGELAEEVFVDATEDVFRAAGLVAHADRADEVDEFA